MCTHITLSSKDGKHLSARTMDFSYELDPEMVMYPRNLKLDFIFDKFAKEQHYAFMGLSKNIGAYMCADGINEHGLSGAELYFEGYSVYADKPAEGKTNLAVHELLIWFLAYCKTTQEAVDALESINVVSVDLELIGRTPPLHWVLQDASGHSVIIEITKHGIEVHKNDLGVLTNSPNYEWHLTNVRNYIGLQPHQNQSRIIQGVELKPFGQASGTFGLPGDLTAPSRFIRALYNKTALIEPANAHDLVVGASHVLNNVDVPKGAVRTERASLDYTQYSSYIVCNDQTYTYRLYDELKYHTVDLNDLDLDQSEIVKL